ncbi:MAG TPA: amidohydrolase family protein [Terriglobia bacterium]|nr:amidohydrolase family protein [Terriglobia bacterium]
MKGTFVLAACLVTSGAALGAGGTVSPAPSPAIVIRGATILTMTHGTIEDGTVVIEDGKIAAVGKDVATPAGAQVIDARGEYVLPGLVDPHSHLGVYSLPGLSANSDGNEMTGDIEAQVRSEDSINTDDPEIPRAVSGGVTIVQVLPGSGNNIGGWATLVKLNGGQTIDEIKFPDAPPSMKWAWGENPKRVYGSRDQAPSTLMGEAAVVRQRLYDAQNYAAKWKAWEDGGKKGAPPARDLQLESLEQVLEGKVRLNIHSYQVNHFETLFRIADEFHFQIAALHHALDAYMIAPEIARRHIGVVTFADDWGFKVEGWDAIPQNAYILWKEGVTVSLHTDNPVIEERNYREQASIISHYGMPDEAALQTVTINPAKILGIDSRVGSIDTGKDADLVVWNGFPLELTSKADKVFIDGKLVYSLTDGFLPWKGRPAGVSFAQD